MVTHIRAVTAVIGIAVIGSAVAAFWYLNSQRVSSAPLVAYVPRDAVFVVQSNRDALMRSPVNRAVHPSLSLWRGQAIAYWTGLEEKIGGKISTLVWFVEKDGEEYDAGVLIEPTQPLNRTRSRELEKLTLREASWLTPEEYKVHVLNPTRIALYPTVRPDSFFHTTRALEFSDTSVGDFFVAQTYRDTLVSLIGHREFEPWFARLKEQNHDMRFSIVEHGDALIVSWETEPDESMHTVDPVQFAVPATFDVLLNGRLADAFDAPEQDPFGRELSDLATRLAFDFALSPDTVAELIRPLSGFVGVGDDWLLAAPERDHVFALGRELAALFTTRVATSTLSDGTAYRELMKLRARPVARSVDGQGVELWTDGSITLYLGTVRGYWYLTNSQALHQTQTSEGRATSLAEVRDCSPSGRSGAVAELAVLRKQRVVLLSVSGPEKRSFASCFR